MYNKRYNQIYILMCLISSHVKFNWFKLSVCKTIIGNNDITLVFFHDSELDDIGLDDDSRKPCLGTCTCNFRKCHRETRCKHVRQL